VSAASLRELSAVLVLLSLVSKGVYTDTLVLKFGTQIILLTIF